MKAFTAIAALVLLLPTFAHASEARVLRVIDGDTIVVQYQENVEKVRLIGVDTPERGQPGFEKAKIFVANVVRGWIVRLEFDKPLRDKFGSLLAYVFLKERPEKREGVFDGGNHAV